ncbi:N-acetylmuramoyl-L-alanine amidase [Lentibacillus halodurans]|uniref:Spore cortex-lytic enzyme n=1 Tax=Lentibacillus halodurans TaxID=237679 RepID=A0A1I0VB25_9BACI|nr:spore cortex-lytic enzyme [Lentibacillus halodurans]SFA73442.1 N-acetylmuramoyl-L-alanine amidase [Lentibacillus halodurans]
MTNKKMYLFIIIGFLAIGLQTTHSAKPVNAFTEQVIQHGAVGEDVIELQARLQYLGFYNGDIDGVFGWSTYWALRNFQYEFGIEIDGLAGSETKEKLAAASEFNREFVKNQIRQGNDFTHYGGVDNEKQSESSPDNNNDANNNNANNNNNNTANDNADDNAGAEATAVNVPQGYSQNDIQLMANAVNGEARGEPYVGQVAVAAVILNRVESSTFPNSVSGVIFEPRAFTAVADGQIWLTPDETSREAVLDAINGWDPSGNAQYYFNPNTATSDWIWSRPQIKKIGKHIFAK